MPAGGLLSVTFSWPPTCRAADRLAGGLRQRGRSVAPEDGVVVISTVSCGGGGDRRVQSQDGSTDAGPEGFDVTKDRCDHDDVARETVPAVGAAACEAGGRGQPTIRPSSEDA
jgi:hypothetical protein